MVSHQKPNICSNGTLDTFIPAKVLDYVDTVWHSFLAILLATMQCLA